jgi:hypothetical protein
MHLLHKVNGAVLEEDMERVRIYSKAVPIHLLNNIPWLVQGVIICTPG